MDEKLEKENLLNYGFEPRNKNFKGTVLLKHGNKYIGYVHLNNVIFATEWDISGECIDCTATIGSLEPLNLAKIWYKHIPEKGLLCMVTIDGVVTDTIVHVKSCLNNIATISVPIVKGLKKEIHKVDDMTISVNSLILLELDFNKERKILK